MLELNLKPYVRVVSGKLKVHKISGYSTSEVTMFTKTSLMDLFL